MAFEGAGRKRIPGYDDRLEDSELGPVLGMDGASQLLHQGYVLHVARFHCGYFGNNGAADQVEVSHEIEHLVAGEFVVETKLRVDDLLVVHEDHIAHDVANTAA